MTDILFSVLVLLALLAGFGALIRYARADRFAGPGMGHRQADELGPLAFRRRPA